MKNTDNLFTRIFLEALDGAVEPKVAATEGAPMDAEGVADVEGEDASLGGTPEVTAEDPSIQAQQAQMNAMDSMEDPFKGISDSLAQWYTRGPDGRSSGKLFQIESELRALAKQPGISGIIDVNKAVAAITELESAIADKAPQAIADRREALAKNAAERQALLGLSV